MSYYWRYLSVICVLLLTFTSAIRADDKVHFPEYFDEVDKRGIMKMRIGKRAYGYPTEEDERFWDKRGIMKMRIGKRLYGDNVEDFVDELYAQDEYLPASNLRIQKRPGIRRMRMG